MDYKEKYEDALEWAKAIYPNMPEEDKEDMEVVFPELAESEDERIRKEIEQLIQGMHNADPRRRRWLDWLEKQGIKQSLPIPNERAWLYLVADVLTWKDRIGQYLDDPRVQNLAKELCSEYAQKLYNPSLLFNSSNTRKNEQKSDKIEPKFHEGEWIVWKNKYYKVNYNGCGYELIDQNGLNTSLEYGTVNNYGHLWTIKDATDGDVLVTTHDNGNGIIIFIFKRIVDDDMFCHCVYDSCMSNKLCFDPCLDSDFIGNINGAEEEFHPATKKQRDLLFKKMKEAMYEWDAVKKELKKIVPKFKVNDCIINKHNFNVNNFEYFIITDITDSKYWYNYRLICDISEQDEWQLYEPVRQKPTTWSEEDENGLGEALWAIKQAKTIAKDENDMGNLWYAERWLKSIKDKVKAMEE